MSTMPYFVTKGPFFSVIEDFARRLDVAGLLGVRNALEGGTPIPDLPAANAATLPAVDGKTPAEHLYTDWLGHEQVGGNWQAGAGTHWWDGWEGDPDAIVRATLIDAIDVAIGYEPPGDGGGYPPEGRATRTVPFLIDFLWVCEAKWFEGWTVWSRPDSERGRVTVIFATPGNGQGVIDDVPSPADGGHEYQVVDPTQRPYGMRVTRSKSHLFPAVQTSACSPPGEHGACDPLVGVVTDVDPVVTHSPNEQDGGVLPFGRAYV